METRTRWTLVTLVGVLGALALSFAVVLTVATSDDTCDPEVREAALSRDVQLVLSGAISYSESIDREADRIAYCGE